MHSRRKFLKYLAAVGATASITQWTSVEARKLSSAVDELAGKAPEEVAKDEDFWKLVRNTYALPEGFIQLENGYFNPQPLPVLQAFLEQTTQINRSSSWFMRREMYPELEKMRQNLARFAGAGSESIALTRNTTESLDILISGMTLEKGDEVIVTEYDYGSMLQAYEQEARRRGIVVRKIELPIRPDHPKDLIKPFREAISERTRAMLVTHLINLNGMVLPAKELCGLGKKYGIEVIVDAAHSFAHLPFKISELECDFLGTSLHKWLAAPLGNGLLYVSRDKIEEIWPLMGDVERPANDIRKFEHQGTRPPASWLAINAALEYHATIGTERKFERLHFLKDYWTSRVDHLPKIQVNTPLKKGMSGAIAHVSVEGMSGEALADHLLKVHQIFTVAVKRSALDGVRVTPNLYNTPKELDQLVHALKKLSK